MKTVAPARRRRIALGRLRSRALIAAPLILGAVGVLLAWQLRGAPAGRERASATDAGLLATAVVARRDLAERETFPGTIGFADERTLRSQVSGTITSLPSEGSVVGRGGTLYEVDEKPVALMYGEEPVWRALRPRVSDGNDVRQLESNLAAVGCAPKGMAIDRHWDRTTTEAMRCWQRRHRLAATGAIALGDVAFLPGPRRIGVSRIDLGARVGPGTPIVDTSAATRVVSMKIDARLRGLVHRGDSVIVELPEGRRVTGTISHVSAVAQPSPDEQSGPTVEVDAALPGAHGSALEQAPVEVLVTKEERKQVLTVPVTALVAAPGSGYLIETIVGARHRFIRVRPGVVADGLVEVAASGLHAGMRVVVAQ